MERSQANRIKRAVIAGTVLLAHIALLWLFFLPRVERAETTVNAEPVIVEFIERPRALSFGPVPVEVKTENVVHLRRLAPKLVDIPVEVPDPATTAITEPRPASAPLMPQANAGLDGSSLASTGKSGGGVALTLIQKVIPRYPVAAALHRETGATRVMLRVDVSGRVSEVRIIKSSGSRNLDNAAVAAFRRWKFAPVPAAATTPGGLWVKTEQPFIYYRFKYSRLSDKAADKVDVEALQPGTDKMIPGSREALLHFIDGVNAGTVTDDSSFGERLEIGKMRDAIAEWGAVKSATFLGTAGPRGWTAYRTREGARGGSPETVELRWNVFQVAQKNSTTAWLIAVDREGKLWAARATSVPWL